MSAATETDIKMGAPRPATGRDALGRVSNAFSTAEQIGRDAGATLRDAAEGGATDGVRPTAERYAASSQVSGVNLIGVMFAIILAAAIGMVGTKVISEIDASIETTSGTVYDNATTSISQGFADAMGLTDIVFLVLMFVVVIGALFLARRAGSF